MEQYSNPFESPSKPKPVLTPEQKREELYGIVEASKKRKDELKFWREQGGVRESEQDRSAGKRAEDERQAAELAKSLLSYDVTDQRAAFETIQAQIAELETERKALPLAESTKDSELWDKIAGLKKKAEFMERYLTLN